MKRITSLDFTERSQQEVIKDVAWKHVAEYGASALSLRAIARELKVTAPAIYNYFPDRDALITALIIDAFVSFGNWQIDAKDATSHLDYATQLTAISKAYRSWAHAFPQRYQLIFGTPVPKYKGPPEKKLPASVRSISALLDVVEGARLAGKVNSDSISQINPAQKTSWANFDLWNECLKDLNMETYCVAIIIWARVHGMVSLELSQSIPPMGDTGDALYEAEIRAIVKQFIQK